MMRFLFFITAISLTTNPATAEEPVQEPHQTQLNKMMVLEKQFQGLSAELKAAKATIKNLEQQINKMDDNSVLALDGFLSLGSKDGYPVALLSGINLQVTNGTGKTDSAVNGLGNIIIGYNETYTNSIEFCSNPRYTTASSCTRGDFFWGNNVRRGSHNLIVGANNSYDDYGSIIAGAGNTSNANYANILGGLSNYTAAHYSSISGGRHNETHAYFSTISGGYDNVTNGQYSHISGGRENTTLGKYASITAGIENLAEGESSSVSGGRKNHAQGHFSSVTSGFGNRASETGSSVTGGQSNRANGFMSNVSGGAIRSEDGYNAWRAGNLHQDF